MAGLTSVAAQAFQILGAANTVLSAVHHYRDDSGEQAINEQKRANALALQQAQDQANTQKARLVLDSQNAEQERKAALKRAIARQKAQYGAAGTGFEDGSAQAVLLGLVNESEEEQAQRTALDTLRFKNLDDQVSNQKRINTLNLTEQRRRNGLNRYTAAFNFADDIKDIF